MRATADQDRRFRYAVAISVAVHLVALFGALPALRESLQEPVAPPPLVTRLVELPKPAPEPAPPPPPETKEPLPRREAKAPEPAKPAPVPAPSATETAPAPPEPPPVASAPAAAPVAPAAPSAQADTRAVEVQTAAQYRLQLIAYAQRNKPPYPAIARENNWSGDVVLEITILADGRAELAMRRGSGHEVLDKLALDTYQQALAAVPVPASLRGKQVRLQPLRVLYNLTEN